MTAATLTNSSAEASTPPNVFSLPQQEGQAPHSTIIALDLGPKLEWRSIPGWSQYEVSDSGKVRRIAPGCGVVVGRILRPMLNKKTGYLSVCLSRQSAPVRIDIHRLVAMAFHGLPPSNEHVVAHNDGSRTNNCAHNIRWATQSENLRDCRTHGTAQVGALNPMTHLDELDVKSIHRMKAIGIPRPVIASGFGLHKRTVFKILSRASWGHIQ